MVDPTIRLPGFDLHRRQWSLLNHFRTGQSHCNACHKKWGFTDNELCDCGEIQTMSHIVNFCPLTKFDGGLLHLHEADEAPVDWLTTYGSYHTLIISGPALRGYRPGINPPPVPRPKKITFNPFQTIRKTTRCMFLGVQWTPSKGCCVSLLCNGYF